MENELVAMNLSKYLLKLLGSILSPGGRHGSLAILIYHRVLPRPDSFLRGIPDADQFNNILGLLAAHFNVLPLGEAIERLQSEDLPPRAVCISFDDGYADNVEIALPILQCHELPATFFVATGYLDGGVMWNDIVLETMRKAPGSTIDLSPIGFDNYPIKTMQDRYTVAEAVIRKIKYLSPDVRQKTLDKLQKALPVEMNRQLMMSTGQLQKLHKAGMMIGGHTVSHPILSSQDQDAACWEIKEGKRILESLIDHSVDYFAYPNGRPGEDYTYEHVQLVKDCGYKGAVTTAWGAVSEEDDLFQLPRFTPWDRGLSRYMLRLVLNYTRKGAKANDSSA